MNIKDIVGRRPHKVYRYNFPNGKIYIGVTSLTMKERTTAHYTNNKYACSKALRKYRGQVTYTILLEGTSEECYQYEANIVDEAFIKRKDTYNETVGGLSPPGVSLKGEDNPMWVDGRTLTTCEDCGGRRAKSCNPNAPVRLCRDCFDHRRFLKARKKKTRCSVCGEFTSRPEYTIHRKCKTLKTT